MVCPAKKIGWYKFMGSHYDWRVGRFLVNELCWVIRRGYRRDRQVDRRAWSRWTARRINRHWSVVHVAIANSKGTMVDPDQRVELGNWCIHRRYHSRNAANRYSSRTDHSHTSFECINRCWHGMVAEAG